MVNEYKIKAYEKNQVELYAVLGESASRTVIFDIVEKSGIVAAVSNAQVTDQMLDLTGYTIALSRIGSSAETAGTIMNAQNGKVSFTLPADFCRPVGEYQCEIVLTKNSERLSIIGIGLIVDYPVSENFDITVRAGFADGVSITLYDENGDIYTLQSGEQLLFRAKRNIDDTQYVLSYDVGIGSGNGYDIAFAPSDTSGLKGEYHYGIGLQKQDGIHPIIEDAVLTVVKTVLTQEAGNE